MSQRKPPYAQNGSGAPAPVLVASLSALVDDTRRHVIPRIAELRRRLHSGELRWECASFGEAVLMWTDAASRLDLQAVHQRGLWASLTGSTDRAVQQFNTGVEKVSRGAALVREELPLFETACRTQQSTRKLLVELDFEHKALLDELAPATDWLAEVAQAMRKTTAAHAANRTWAAAHARADTLPQEIRRFHLVANTAHSASALGLDILARRADALDAVRGILSDFDRTWMQRVPSLVRKPRSTLQATAMSPVQIAGIHQDLLQRLDTLSHLLHELESAASELHTQLWELAELTS